MSRIVDVTGHIREHVVDTLERGRATWVLLLPDSGHPELLIVSPVLHVFHKGVGATEQVVEGADGYVITLDMDLAALRLLRDSAAVMIRKLEGN